MPPLHALPALDLERDVDLEPTPSSPKEHALELLALAPPGRILELSGQARTTLAARLLAQVQAAGEPVAWVTTREAGLYPPDLVQVGIDLSTLVIVQLDARSLHRGPQAAELLLRTGAFGAVVLDSWKLAPSTHQRSTAWQGRLTGILRTHDARLILLSHPELPGASQRDVSQRDVSQRDVSQRGDHAESDAGPSMGPLVSVRLGLYRERQPDGQLVVRTRVLKDKSGALAHRRMRAEPHLGPAGSRWRARSLVEASDAGKRQAAIVRLRRVR